MSSKNNWRYAIDRVVRRRLRRPLARIFHRTNRTALTKTFRNIGLGRGDVVCVHSSLSRLGHVDGGPEAVILALLDTVGESGTILMPSFPTGGSMARYIEKGERFDVRISPSKVGRITEVFRQWSGVQRSLHPTNPVCGWGRFSEEILRDHEKSITPYGLETPYGRLAERSDSYILMMETHVHSFLHHLQERVNFPNFFLPEERDAGYIDANGKHRIMRTKLMRPRIPYFVAIPSISGEKPDWAILHDFALLFPGRRESKVRRLGYTFEGYPSLFDRRKALEQAGTLHTARVGAGEIGLLHVRRYLEVIEPEFRGLISRFRTHYDPEHIAALNLPYF